MFKLDGIKDMTEEERLKYMNYLLKSQISSEDNSLSNLSNATGIIKACVDRLNWAGFYLMRDGDVLVLGPFQGKPACNRIELGKGVCGTAAKNKETILVEDVLDFPGHIFCDGDSKSELVVPIIVGDRVRGVLDLDSPVLDRFGSMEKEYFEEFVETLEKNIDWDEI